MESTYTVCCVDTVTSGPPLVEAETWWWTCYIEHTQTTCMVRERDREGSCTMMSTVEPLQSGNPCESVLISVVTKYTNMPFGSVDMNL